LPLRTPFFGPLYVSRSTNLADQRLINIYPELVETKTGKDVGAFYGCPGLTLYRAVGGGPIKAMLVSNGLIYVVSGGQLYSESGTVTRLIGDVSLPGAYLYNLIGDTFSPVALPLDRKR